MNTGLRPGPAGVLWAKKHKFPTLPVAPRNAPPGVHEQNVWLLEGGGRGCELVGRHVFPDTAFSSVPCWGLRFLCSPWGCHL